MLCQLSRTVGARDAVGMKQVTIVKLLRLWSVAWKKKKKKERVGGQQLPYNSLGCWQELYRWQDLGRHMERSIFSEKYIFPPKMVLWKHADSL